MAGRDLEAAFRLVQQVETAGKDPALFARQAAEFFRDLLVLKLPGSKRRYGWNRKQPGAPGNLRKDRRDPLKEWGRVFPRSRDGDPPGDRRGPLLEMALVRLILEEPGAEAFSERLAALEERLDRVEKGRPGPYGRPRTVSREMEKGGKAAPKEGTAKTRVPEAGAPGGEAGRGAGAGNAQTGGRAPEAPTKEAAGDGHRRNARPKKAQTRDVCTDEGKGRERGGGYGGRGKGRRAPQASSGIFPGGTRLLEEMRGKKRTVEALLKGGDPRSYRPGRLVVAFAPGFRFHWENIKRPDNLRLVEEVPSRLAGEKITVECVLEEEEDTRTSGNEPELVQKALSLFGDEVVKAEEEE